MYTNINEFYSNDCPEELRLLSQAGKIEYLTTMHYLQRLCTTKSDVLDACAGTGVYAFPLATLGHRVVAGDLIAANVSKIQEQNRKTTSLADIYEGSILDLSRFENESFDVVLNLGAYYHLCNEDDRKKSIQESIRVLKNNGLFFMAYINRYANFIGHAGEMTLDFGLFEKFMETGMVDTVFYSTTPENAEKDVRSFGLTILHNIAADGPLFHLRDTINSMDSSIFDRYMKIHLTNCEVRSTLGISEHGLIICRK